jgi:hypothetical protein
MSRADPGGLPPAPTTDRPASWLLAIDTATATAVVALGERAGRLVEERAWRAGYRGELLADRRAARARGATVGVSMRSCGRSGSLTGLRGLATAKGLPTAGRTLAGSTASPAEAALTGGAVPPLALLLPAGPADRVLVVGGSPEVLPGGHEPDLPAGTTLVAVDLDGRAPEAAVELGRRASGGLGAALLRIGAGRLALGQTDDIGAVVPEYVTLPRGVREQVGEVTWSRDRR